MNILNFEKRISDLTQKVKELEEDLKNSQDNCSELELCKSELESCVVPNDVFRRTDAKRLKAEMEVVRLEKENAELKKHLKELEFPYGGDADAPYCAFCYSSCEDKAHSDTCIFNSINQGEVKNEQ